MSVKCVECGSVWVVNKKYSLCEKHNNIRLHGSPYKKQKPIVKSKKRGGVLKKDRAFYLKVFSSKPCFCEECDLPLPKDFEDDDGNIIAIWQYSHVLPKSRFQEYRHKDWNMRKLCFKHHQVWDFGDKTEMKLYKIDKEIVYKKTGKLLLK